MKKISLLTLFVLLSMNAFAQQPEWTFIKQIGFPQIDTDSNWVQPYLTTMDSQGRLYVASSKVTRASAHNAIYYLDPGDTVFKKWIDYDLNGDSDTLTGNIAAIRGIGSLGTDLFIDANIPFQRVANTLSSLYRYSQGDTNLVEKFGFNINGSGYGTYIHGIALTKDTIIMTGITFNTSIRFYNFNRAITTPAYGSWVSLTTYPMEPGGPHNNGFDVIRDIATVPNADYLLPETPFYTSRNSLSAAQVTGGIAIWTGGSQLNPGGYTGTRIADASGELALGTSIAYGINVDKDGYLWVAGNDTTRKWVKAYQVLINFANNVYSLPSATDPVNPDPNGAPFANPNDVVISADGNTAYVTDAGTKTVHLFRNIVVGIKDKISDFDFALNQNYPNPFNPSTVISYKLAQAGDVRLIVTNSLGEVVETLISGYKEAGSHAVQFDGSKLSSGVYNYTLITANGVTSRKMILVK